MKRKWRVRLELKLQDMWIGVFWKHHKDGIDVYVCIIPCLPIHFETWIPLF